MAKSMKFGVRIDFNLITGPLLPKPSHLGFEDQAGSNWFPDLDDLQGAVVSVSGDRSVSSGGFNARNEL
jgi:hypothetical protein